MVWYQVRWKGYPEPDEDEIDSWIYKKNAGTDVLQLMYYFDDQHGRPNKNDTKREGKVTFSQAEKWARKSKDPRVRRLRKK